MVWSQFRPQLLIALSFLPVSFAAAQQEEQGERVHDAPGTPAFVLQERALWPATYPFTAQANAGAGGLNIVGDAANEPSIAVDPSNGLRIVVGWRQFDSVTSDFRQAGYAYSVDGGRTFTRGTLNSGVFRSDPVVRWGADGVVHYYSLTTFRGPYTCDMFRSHDGGRTWLSPTYARGGDKNWFTIAKNAGPGLGNIYGHWTLGYTCCDGFMATRSRDGAETFPDLFNVPGNPQWGTSAVGPDGELYVCGAAQGRFNVSRSDNAQLNLPSITFSQSNSQLILGSGQVAFDSSGPNPAGILGQAWVDVDRSNTSSRGWVYLLCSVAGSGTDPLNVMLMRSTDRGVTWSTPVRVNDEPLAVRSWQWFGTMGVAPTGRIDVVYNDTSAAGVARQSITKYTASFDHGTTWTPSVAIGPQWDSWIGWPNQNKIGDYYDIASDALGCFVVYSATYNGEQDVYVARIGAYDCNNNGTDDAADIAAGTSRDCNGNGIPDECEIGAGTLADSDGDGIADLCDCAADFNSDGVTDFFDYLDFVEAFADQLPSADFNHDSIIDFFDYLDFVDTFASGC